MRWAFERFVTGLLFKKKHAAEVYIIYKRGNVNEQALVFWGVISVSANGKRLF